MIDFNKANNRAGALDSLRKVKALEAELVESNSGDGANSISAPQPASQSGLGPAAG